MPDDLNMNQKLENILNVSLDATEDELRKADSLSTGYNWRDNTWEIIVKYSGSLESIRNRYNVYIKELLNYYAIIVADKATIELISQEDVIDYVEKPKSLYYQDRTHQDSCMRRKCEGRWGHFIRKRCYCRSDLIQG